MLMKAIKLMVYFGLLLVWIPVGTLAMWTVILQPRQIFPYLELVVILYAGVSLGTKVWEPMFGSMWRGIIEESRGGKADK